MKKIITERLQQIASSFAGLNQREKIMVSVAGIFTILFIMFFVVSSVKSSISNYKERIASSANMLEKIESLQSRYLTAKKTVAKRMDRLSGNKVNILSAIGTLADRYGIEIASISQNNTKKLTESKFHEESAKVSLKRMDPKTVLAFMREIESYEEGSLFLSSIKLKKRYDNRSQVDVDLEVSTIKVKE